MLCWNRETTDQPVARMLEILSASYPIRDGKGGEVNLLFKHDPAVDRLTIACRNGTATIRHRDTASAARAVGSLLSGLVPEGSTMRERMPPATLGVMLDCSRNAVVTVAHFKQWLNRLALLGFNMAMLYTEDTYRLPGEPCFGYARGAYTMAELQEIDGHADALGLEMIPCFQTLGHLEQVLKWWPYDPIKDNDAILLVDDERSYGLIGKMLDFWSDAFGSRRVHIGMDEAYGLGRNRFLDRFGYHEKLDVFKRHLARVAGMCRERGLKPIIWSDMLFCLSNSTGSYYDPTCADADRAAKSIPAATTLVYWDYYHTEVKFYRDAIARHRAMGFEPMVASAVMTPYRFWYDHGHARQHAVPCIQACRREGVEGLFFTLWGDDGAYCDFDSAQAGLTLLAEYVFSERVSQGNLHSRFHALCGGDYRAHRIASEIHALPGIRTAGILWDDPLLGIYMRGRLLASPESLRVATAHYASVATRLAAYRDDRAAGDVNHAWIVAKVLAQKSAFADDLLAAYSARDQARLIELSDRVPAIVAGLRELAGSFRRIWMERNKPFGLEVLQIRLAGLVARFEELAIRLEELQQGRIQIIEELEENSPGCHGYEQYRRLASATVRL